MPAPEVEAFMARLYCDGDFLKRYLADPAGVVSAGGFTDAQRESLCAIDHSQLILAARSYRMKREKPKKK